MSVAHLSLRDYQHEARDAVRAAWAGGMRRPAVVLPTGAGKTVVIADLIRSAELDAGHRSLVLAHRDELISQTVAKIRAVAPALRVGIVKGAVDQVGADVVVASVQTLRHAARRARVRNVGLVVVDECHHATAPSYRTVLDHYGCFGATPAAEHRTAVAVGFTATMSRGDGVGLGEVWEEVAYERDIQWMIRRGFLVEPRGVYVRVEDLDLRNVRRSGGDYAEGALGEALTDSLAPERIVDAYREHARDRPGLLFAPTVEFGQLMAERLTEAGIPAAAVWGAMGLEARRATLMDFEAGRIQVLCNCMVLTEGTDLPKVSCVVMARPTQHIGFYTQMVGRGLRPSPGKDDCLVLDVVGVTKRHALAGLTDLIGTQGIDTAEKSDVDVVEVGPDAPDLFDDPGGDWDRPAAYADGPLVVEAVDLFHGSRGMWLKTRAGIWFLPTDKRFLVLVRGVEAGTWDVVAMYRRRVGVSYWVVRGIPDRGYAMAYGEADVTPEERMVAMRAAGWRKRPATGRQEALAAQYGLIVSAGMRSGEVSNMITCAEATARIDHRVPAYAR